MEENYILDLHRFDDVDHAVKQDIDSSIKKILTDSNYNEKEIAQLVLECSGALESAKERKSVLSNQSFFSKIWGKVTGKNEILKRAIERDQNVVQYAMQKVILRVLDICRHNRELSVSIYNKLEWKIDNLNTDQVKLSEDLSQTRRCLVAVADKFNTCISQLNDRIERQQSCMAQRCEKCRESISEARVVCPYCGTVQTIKSHNITEEMKKLSHIIQNVHSDCVADITWNKEIAQKTAFKILKVHDILQLGSSCNIQVPETMERNMNKLVTECRDTKFQIAVVGVLKAGKSMLMNALIGADLAPVGLNSKTAALTKFHSSSTGNYVVVKFYSAQSWNQLKKSVQTSKDQDNGYSEKLKDPKINIQIKRWIGQKNIKIKCNDMDSLKKEIYKWVASDSLTHLFVSEVEVGIDKKQFDMPEEVEFVDTPGLLDPITYRSDITKKYIRNADAALIALRPQALNGEDLKTITMVLEQVGVDKRERVYIVGTQKDILNDLDDYSVLTGCGNGTELLHKDAQGWAQRLVAAKAYKSLREVQAQIITTSAFMHLCLKKITKYTEEELKNPDIFSDAEYNGFKKNLSNLLKTRDCSIYDLKYSPANIQKVYDVAGIESLKKRIKSELIDRCREIKIESIIQHYELCVNEVGELIDNRLRRNKHNYNLQYASSENCNSELDALKEEKAEIEKKKEMKQSILNKFKTLPKRVDQILKDVK